VLQPARWIRQVRQNGGDDAHQCTVPGRRRRGPAPSLASFHSRHEGAHGVANSEDVARSERVAQRIELQVAALHEMFPVCSLAFNRRLTFGRIAKGVTNGKAEEHPIDAVPAPWRRAWLAGKKSAPPDRHLACQPHLLE
jgi:hypothetical protein